MRWYFTLESEQFLQFCNIFFEEVKAKQRTFKLILKHFSKLQYNYMKLFEEWTKNLFLLHLPLPVTIIIIFWINFRLDGIKNFCCIFKWRCEDLFSSVLWNLLYVERKYSGLWNGSSFAKGYHSKPIQFQYYKLSSAIEGLICIGFNGNEEKFLRSAVKKQKWNKSFFFFKLYNFYLFKSNRKCVLDRESMKFLILLLMSKYSFVFYLQNYKILCLYSLKSYGNGCLLVRKWMTLIWFSLHENKASASTISIKFVSRICKNLPL